MSSLSLLSHDHRRRKLDSCTTAAQTAATRLSCSVDALALAPTACPRDCLVLRQRLDICNSGFSGVANWLPGELLDKSTTCVIVTVCLVRTHATVASRLYGCADPDGGIASTRRPTNGLITVFDVQKSRYFNYGTGDLLSNCYGHLQHVSGNRYHTIMHSMMVLP